MSHYAFKLYIQQQPFPKILIGFDFGMKSTGVAVTSSDLLHAFVIIFSKSIWQQSRKIFELIILDSK